MYLQTAWMNGCKATLIAFVCSGPGCFKSTCLSNAPLVLTVHIVHWSHWNITPSWTNWTCDCVISFLLLEKGHWSQTNNEWSSSCLQPFVWNSGQICFLQITLYKLFCFRRILWFFVNIQVVIFQIFIVTLVTLFHCPNFQMDFIQMGFYPGRNDIGKVAQRAFVL